MAFNALQQLRTNIESIRIALAFRPGDYLDKKQADTLRAYAGFGGLKAVLFPEAPVEEWKKQNASKNDLRLYPSFMELEGKNNSVAAEAEVVEMQVAASQMPFDEWAAPIVARGQEIGERVNHALKKTKGVRL